MDEHMYKVIELIGTSRNRGREPPLRLLKLRLNTCRI